ncbi:PREDICTED: translocation protein SEC63 homolog [Priapulus caudatus]|uniref:Translocation protein SEC63 homolog n=1 Tax=Priapulus caudatus TaxID=37621 RepID=A0ABM1F5D5_PRICU|nr:PREDICTED: translocation protein SEC63 homolog [Priapulus caudatus]
MVGAQEAPIGPLMAESDRAKIKTGHEKSKNKESNGDIADSEPESDSGSDSVSTKETHHDKDGSEGEAEDDDWNSFNLKKRKETLETKSRCSHSVHCPHFPEDKQEWWWLYVANRRHRPLPARPHINHLPLSLPLILNTILIILL